MSTIKLEFDSEDNRAVAGVAALTNSLLGKTNIFSEKLAKMEVVDAEEVKAPAPVKTPTPRPSRAKPKPAPVEEVEDEDEDFSDEEEATEDESDDEDITADDLRAKQAEKVDKHRAAIKAELGKLKATGIKDLDEKHYAKYFDFLSKLK